MTSKAQGVAYKPLNTGIPINSAPTKIDEPQYSDVGVRFENYSRQLMSGNTYRLNKQTPAYLTHTTYNIQVVGDGLLYPLEGTTTSGNLKDKTFYLTDVTIAIVNNDAVVYLPNWVQLGIYNTTSGFTCLVKIPYCLIAGGIFNYHVNLSVPIPFKGYPNGVSTYPCVYIDSAGANVDCKVGCNGWFE